MRATHQVDKEDAKGMPPDHHTTRTCHLIAKISYCERRPESGWVWEKGSGTGWVRSLRFFCFISVRKNGAQDSLGNQISVRSTRFYNQTKKKINEAVSARAGEGSSVLDKFFLFWVNQARRCVCAANIGLHTISLAWNEGFPFIKKKFMYLLTLTINETRTDRMMVRGIVNWINGEIMHLVEEA